MTAAEVELLTPVPTMRIGRTKALHSHRVLIENGRVVVRTRCGIDPTVEGWTETFGFLTCEPCIADYELAHLDGEPTHDRAVARGSEAAT